MYSERVVWVDKKVKAQPEELLLGMYHNYNYNYKTVIIRATHTFPGFEIEISALRSRFTLTRMTTCTTVTWAGHNAGCGFTSDTPGSRPIPVYAAQDISLCCEGSTWCPTHVQRQHATWNSKLRTPRWNFTASGIRLEGGERDDGQSASQPASQAHVCPCVSRRKADCLTWWIVREKFTRFVSDTQSRFA